MIDSPLVRIAVVAAYLIIIGFLYTNTIHFATSSAFQAGADSNTNNTSANIIDTRSHAFNANESQGKIGPADINDDNQSGSKQSSSIGTPKLVAKELRTLPPEQLTNYPINDLSSNDLVTVLNMLSIEDLDKTLSNISPDTLRELLNSKLPQDKADEILNRLPVEKSQEILKRILPS